MPPVVRSRLLTLAVKPRDGPDGAVYHFISRPTSVLGGRSKTIAFDITAPIYQGGSTFEVMVAQKGLKAGGWQSMVAKGSRAVYTLSYDPIPETRTGPKVDSIWVRSDTTGLGHAVIVHEMRIYDE